jgi:rare lipoprotein A
MRRCRPYAILLAVVFGCAQAPVARRPQEQAGRSAQQGTASYYGADFAGRRTASGERFDPQALTAAHPDLPFGTLVRVTNLENGRSVTVRINDRGPFTGGRIVDVSWGAARELGMLRSGVARVRLDLVSR